MHPASYCIIEEIGTYILYLGGVPSFFQEWLVMMVSNQSFIFMK